MSIPTSLAELSAYIYNCYARHGKGGIPFFESFSPALRSYEPSEVIAFQVNSYDILYVRDFLLSVPNLVGVMDSSAWARAFVSAGPRAPLRPSDVHMQGQGDLYFVCKYLRLNAVEFALNCVGMSRTDKEKVLRKARACAPFLVLDELDEEDLDGVHFVSRAFLENTANELLREGRWSRLANDPAEITAQLTALSM